MQSLYIAIPQYLQTGFIGAEKWGEMKERYEKRKEEK